GTGQGYEQLLLRMRAHPLREVRVYADLMLVELRKVIPAFLKRVDVAERGGAWSAYLEETRRETREIARRLVEPASAAAPRTAGAVAGETEEVTLTDFDPDGELKVVAAALYAVSSRGDAELLEAARRMTRDERAAVLAAYVGKRLNRRHRPGRAFERTSYRFHVPGDSGAYRDLQRPRGDARHRATDGAPGTSCLSPRLPADASAHRRAPSGHRRGDDLRGSLGGRARAAASRARRRAPAHCLSVLTMEDAR